jgi:hypothetical protein
VLALVPARRGPEPRSRFGRVVYLLLVLGLSAPLLDAGRLGTAGALLGAGLVVVSFGRSFYFSYAASRAQPESER